MADWCRSNDDSDRVTLPVFSVSGDYRESKGSHSFSPQHREQRLLCGSPNGFRMESKSLFFSRFKENTNTEDVSNIIYPFPISLRCGYAYKYRCTTALAQCWPGCVWRWMASRWCSPPLATTARPTCRPFRTKSTARCSSSEIHNIMNFHWLYLMFWPSRCNFLYGTPTMFTDLVNQDIHKYDLSSVEAGKRSEHRNTMSMFWLWCDVWRRPRLCAAVSGLMGGAPCPPEILRKLKTDMNVKEISVSDCTSDSFSNNTVRLFQHIWTSEHCVSTGGLWNHWEQPCYIYWISTRQRGAEAEYCRMYHEPHWGILSQKPGSVFNHDSTVTYSRESSLQAKVVDPAGQIVPLGTPGELMIRGSCVMHGYWEDPEKTREAICPARWYRTGWVQRVFLKVWSNLNTFGLIQK